MQYELDLENTILVSNFPTREQTIQSHREANALNRIPVFNQAATNNLPCIYDIQTLRIVTSVTSLQSSMRM